MTNRHMIYMSYEDCNLYSNKETKNKCCITQWLRTEKKLIFSYFPICQIIQSSFASFIDRSGHRLEGRRLQSSISIKIRCDRQQKKNIHTYQMMNGKTMIPSATQIFSNQITMNDSLSNTKCITFHIRFAIAFSIAFTTQKLTTNSNKGFFRRCFRLHFCICFRLYFVFMQHYGTQRPD